MSAGRYHVNPATGEPGACKAQHACPFGGSEAHADSAEEARTQYEARMAEEAVPEGARRGKLLLDNLDETYKRLEREKNEEAVRDLEAATDEIIARRKERRQNEAQIAKLEEGMDKVSAELAEATGDADFVMPEALRFTEEEKEAQRREWRKGLLDTIEGRTGERLPRGTWLTLVDKDGMKSVPMADYAVGEAREPGEYYGYAVNANGEPEDVIVGVYSDGTSRAFRPDLRDNLPYRENLAKEKEVELSALAEDLDADMQASDREDIALALGATSALVGEAVRGADWSSPESAAEALGKLGELEEDFRRKAENEPDDETAAAYRAIADRLYDAQEGDYELAGRQKLPPMKPKPLSPEQKQELVKPTRQSLAKLVTEVQDYSGEDNHVWMTRQRAGDVIASVVLNRDWETVEDASQALSDLDETRQSVLAMANDPSNSASARVEFEELARLLDRTQENATKLRSE